MSDFAETDLSSYSETDIREEVIAPVLRQLGYRSGTHNDILRERAIELRYPHLFLGPKKHGKDPVLRGRPDYICDARNVTRWVIEAKPPSSEISHDDIEQAHSYAVHPELAAPLFVLCNGHEWQIFESNRGPVSSPILKITQRDVVEKFHLLSGVLSPAGLNRRYPVKEVDIGKPLSSHLGSKVRITGGFTRYDDIQTAIEGMPSGATLPGIEDAKKLIGYRASIVGDRCYRDEENGIVADIRMHHPYDEMIELANKLGLVENRYVTRDAVISESPDQLSIFEYTTQCRIPAGEKVFDITTWREISVPVPIDIAVYAEATGHAADKLFKGTYACRMLADFQLGIRQCTFIRGTFEIEFDEF